MYIVYFAINAAKEQKTHTHIHKQTINYTKN